MTETFGTWGVKIKYFKLRSSRDSYKDRAAIRDNFFRKKNISRDPFPKGHFLSQSFPYVIWKDIQTSTTWEHPRLLGWWSSQGFDFSQIHWSSKIEMSKVPSLSDKWEVHGNLKSPPWNRTQRNKNGDLFRSFWSAPLTNRENKKQKRSHLKSNPKTGTSHWAYIGIFH